MAIEQLTHANSRTRPAPAKQQAKALYAARNNAAFQQFLYKAMGVAL